ncbi:Sensor histidine kinase RcsC [compost metagenome]
MERMGETRAWVDGPRLRQVLDNLMSNALAFTDRGEVVLRALTTAQGMDQAELVLEVEDSGVGVAEEEQAQLFEPFRQLPDPQRLARGGTGLGLALCERLVKLMGGSIELASRRGVGTRVRVRLPLPLAGE